MKRRTKSHVGQYPNMSNYTLKSIAEKLVRAREKHPKRGAHLSLLMSYTQELHNALTRHHSGVGMAVNVQALAYTVAAMAIRVAEEGDVGFKFAGIFPNLFSDGDLGPAEPVGD